MFILSDDTYACIIACFMLHVYVSTLLDEKQIRTFPSEYIVTSLFLMTQSWFTNILRETRRGSVTENVTQERLRRLFESFQFANTFNITPSRPYRGIQYCTLRAPRVAIGHLYSTFQFCFICAKDWAFTKFSWRECVQDALQYPYSVSFNDSVGIVILVARVHTAKKIVQRQYNDTVVKSYKIEKTMRERKW